MAFQSKKGQTPPSLDQRLKHIAFIMDGNGRWAKKRGMPREYGHRAGAKTFRNIALYCEKLGLEAMTVYAFSTENWKRPPHEVQALMDLLEEYLDQNERELDGHSLQFHFLGNRDPLRPSLREKMKLAEQKTAGGRMILNIAVNYGAREELCHAFDTLCRQGIDHVNEQQMASALYTAHCSDPDLIIRTGGELRISNFLLWQAAYAELYFTDILWPDLKPSDVDDAIRDFYSRKRRFGGA